MAGSTASILLTIPQPGSNHNGGGLHFGTDGYLYTGSSDGGSGSNHYSITGGYRYRGNRSSDLFGT